MNDWETTMLFILLVLIWLIAAIMFSSLLIVMVYTAVKSIINVSITIIENVLK